jgi:hypothetical protein
MTATTASSADPGAPATSRAGVTVVIPTVGRPSLHHLLESLERACGGVGVVVPVVVADDRQSAAAPLRLRSTPWLDVSVVTTRGGAGPATARNAGWRATTTAWVAFLDDDVVVGDTWLCDLLRDIEHAGWGATKGRIGAVQGRVEVPLPGDRRPTDRERNVAGLERAPWITADMAVRRAALLDVDGFDERFPRAYREDSDLGIRVRDAGWQMAVGSRQVRHPVADAPWSASVRAQRGNADDALMRRLHGPRWRGLAGAPRSALPLHLATTLAAAVAVTTARGAPRTSALAAALWFGATARFAWRRIRPGPRTRQEVLTMVATSALIPPAALWWRVRGHVRARRAVPAHRLAGQTSPS